MLHEKSINQSYAAQHADKRLETVDNIAIAIKYKSGQTMLPGSYVSDGSEYRRP